MSGRRSKEIRKAKLALGLSDRAQTLIVRQWSRLSHRERGRTGAVMALAKTVRVPAGRRKENR